MSLRRIHPQVTDFSLSGRSRPDQPTGFSRLVIEYLTRTFAWNFSFKQADELEYVGGVTRYANSHSTGFVSLGRALFLAF